MIIRSIFMNSNIIGYVILLTMNLFQNLLTKNDVLKDYLDSTVVFVYFNP